jgi:hypothetical protein
MSNWTSTYVSHTAKIIIHVKNDYPQPQYTSWHICGNTYRSLLLWSIKQLRWSTTLVTQICMITWKILCTSKNCKQVAVLHQTVAATNYVKHNSNKLIRATCFIQTSECVLKRKIIVSNIYFKPGSKNLYMHLLTLFLLNIQVVRPIKP